MPTTTYLDLIIGYNNNDNNSVWLDQKDANFVTLDYVIGLIYNSAEENNIPVEPSNNEIEI